MNKKRLYRAFAIFSVLFLIKGVKASASCNYINNTIDSHGSVSGNQSSGNNGNGGSGGSTPKYTYKAPTQDGSQEHPYKVYYTQVGEYFASLYFPSFYNNNSNANNVVLENRGYDYDASTPKYIKQNDGSVLVVWYRNYIPSVIGNVTTTPKNATLTDVLDHYVWGRTGVEPLAEFNSGSSSYDFTPSQVGQTSVHCYGVRRHVEGYWQDKNGNAVLKYSDGHEVNVISKSDSKLNYREETTYPPMQRQDWDFNISPAEVGKTINTDYYKPISNTDKSAEAWADTQLIQ